MSQSIGSGGRQASYQWQRQSDVCFFFAAQEYNQLLTIDVTAYHGYEDFTIDLMATAINMMPAFPISYR